MLESDIWLFSFSTHTEKTFPVTYDEKEKKKSGLEGSCFLQPVTFFLSLQGIAGKRQEAGQETSLGDDPKGGFG